MRMKERWCRVIRQDALARRINRALANKQQALRRCRENSRGFHDLGRYYLVDVTRNSVIDTHVNVEALGVTLNVLGEG